jgi:primosomal protein N' (replication factor Y)
MAVVRGHIAKIPVVLASATPSIETEVNARRGRYRRLSLPERFGGARLPSVEAIDLRRVPPPPGRFISPVLAEAVKTALERKEQALLFLNRRGYAPLTLCRACGFRFSCPNCDAWLVDHRFRKQLVCHHCGFAMPHPRECPNCKAADSYVAVGPGVERLEEEVRALFPEARVLVLSSDLVATVERMREEFADVAKGLFDIVIGTQLVAKGHHFPMLNLVGVIDADLGLSNGDPRAAERTFQLLHQVVGRAGRDAGTGHGFLQTHQPEHPVMRALIAQDREAFYSAEIDLREKAHYPPFGRLASIVVSGPDKNDTAAYARALARAAPAADLLDGGVRLLGPAEAPLALVRGRHRLRLLIRAPRGFDLAAYLREWLAAAPKKHGSIKLDIDVDPQSFL